MSEVSERTYRCSSNSHDRMHVQAFDDGSVFIQMQSPTLSLSRQQKIRLILQLLEQEESVLTKEE